MSLNSPIVIAVFIFSFFAWRFFLKHKANKKYEKTILQLSTQENSWIELANNNFQSLMFGKVLYSFDGYVAGVGVLVRELLPEKLASDIETKIDPQLLDGQMPICRFIIDTQGQETIFTELKDEPLKQKLMPYVDEYSNIKLLIGLKTNEYILIDSKEAENTFKQVWQATQSQKKLYTQTN